MYMQIYICAVSQNYDRKFSILKVLFIILSGSGKIRFQLDSKKCNPVGTSIMSVDITSCRLIHVQSIVPRCFVFSHLLQKNMKTVCSVIAVLLFS